MSDPDSPAQNIPEVPGASEVPKVPDPSLPSTLPFGSDAPATSDAPAAPDTPVAPLSEEIPILLKDLDSPATSASLEIITLPPPPAPPVIAPVAPSVSSTVPTAPTEPAGLSRSLYAVAAFSLGLFVLVRPLVFQLTPLKPEAALAGLAAVLFSLSVWAAITLDGKRVRPEIGMPGKSVLFFLFAWLGLIGLGLWHSPNLDLAIPRVTEWASYGLLFLGVHFLIRSQPTYAAVLVRVILAVCAMLAFWGLWQKYVQLPYLWEQVQSGNVAIPDALQSSTGNRWLYAGEPDATFGNANSFAAFLLIGILLHAGILIGRMRKLSNKSALCHLALLALLLFTFQATHSKGAVVALGFGIFLLIIQHYSTNTERRWKMSLLGFFGVGLLVTLIVLGATGILPARIFGYSMFVRFEYWKTGYAMWQTHEPLGVGLSGFGEWYFQFKTLLATETKEAHNDWWQFAVELGVLAPIVWGAFWWVVLRRRKRALLDIDTAPARVECVPAASFSTLTLMGACAGMFLMYAGFESLDVSELWKLFSGDKSGHAISAVGPVLAPVFLIATFLLYKNTGTEHPEPDQTLVYAARAAIGAILLHQLVDFDHAAQAVMAELFLLGGLLTALREPLIPSIEKPSRWTHLLPISGIALVPFAILLPLNFGLARQSGEALEEAFNEQWAQIQAGQHATPSVLPTIEKALEVRELLTSSVRYREQAAQAAPSNGQAQLDLALAYLNLSRAGLDQWSPDSLSAPTQPLNTLIQDALLKAERLRPGWSAPPMMRGHDALRRGFEAQSKQALEDTKRCFEEAAQAYTDAAKRYPLNPMMQLSIGDAWLFSGNWAEAEAAFNAAWDLDVKIYDPATRVSSIFYDRKPGCLTRHNREAAVLKILEAHPPASGNPLKTRAWCVRKLTALASIKLLPQADLVALNSEMFKTCIALYRALPKDPHASFFYASALEINKAEAADIQAAWKTVEDLREEARHQKEPLVIERVVEETREFIKSGGN